MVKTLGRYIVADSAIRHGTSLATAYGLDEQYAGPSAGTGRRA